MKVLHVITRLIRGGAQENTLLTAAYHRAWGLDAIIATGPPADEREGHLHARCSEAGVPLRNIPALCREPHPAKDLQALAQLVRLVRDEAPDVVHTHTSKAGFLGRMAAQMAGAPVVIHTPHGHIFDAYYGAFLTQVYTLLERLGDDLADRIIALTPREVADHLARGIGAPAQFRIVPSGVDVARFPCADEITRKSRRESLGLPQAAFVIGAIGRLAPVKGQTTLIEAFASLRHALPGARLVLVGDGPDRDTLTKQVEALGLAPAVLFAGHVGDAAPFYAAVDVLAVPSRNEGMGRVIIEAMAAGVPVVASRVGGIPDLVTDGETGLLVPPSDPELLRLALLTLANQPELGRTLAAAAQQRVVPHYGAEAMARSLLSIYDEASAEKAITTIRMRR